jgi:diacylglycerol O-acyltransferase
MSQDEAQGERDGPPAHYERLSAVDATLLNLEDANAHMHVGAIAVYDKGPLRSANGALDIERLLSAADSTLHPTPRLRQRLAFVPLLRHPVWVDDDRFNLSYHVRHTALPPPGDERQLKRLAGRIMSQQLDRGKPLWEMWLVEGLAGDRFATIVKAHHCMVDGISGLGTLASMMRVDESRSIDPAPLWQPRPQPAPRALLRDEVLRRASVLGEVLDAGRRALRTPREALSSLRDSAMSLAEVLSAGLRRGSPTPLNVAVGPHRRVDWARVDLTAIKEVRQRLGGTVNDVVLACIAGALRRFLERRGLRPDELVFRSMVPVNTREAGAPAALGNQVTFVVADLPVAERQPQRRLTRVMATMDELKRSRQVAGMDLLERISDRALPMLFREFGRLGYQQRVYNMGITNIPGPPMQLFLQGAPLREIYPIVPIFPQQALSIGLFSYHGVLHWGFTCDWDILPDLHDIVVDVEGEFESLRRAAA